MIEINEMESIRIRNMSIIWHSLRHNGEMSISGLADDTEIGLTTVKKYIEQGIKSSMLTVSEKTISTGGRKAKQFGLNSSYQYFLLIAVDNEMLHYKLLDFSLKTVIYKSCVFKTTEYLVCVEDIINSLTTEYPNIGSVCLSIPCVVKDGVITDWYYNSAMNGFNIEKYLTEKYHRHTVIQNSMKLSVLGRLHREKDEKSTIATVQFGHDGIGAALAANGEIVEGKAGFAGEIGFLSHDREDINNYSFLIKIVNSIIIFLNPSKIIFYSSLMRNDFDGIFAAATAGIPQYAVPEYEISGDYIEDIYAGLTECISRNGYFEI